MNLSNVTREFHALDIHLQCTQAISNLDREHALQEHNLYLKAKNLLEGREAGRWPKIGKDREVTMEEEVALFLTSRPSMRPNSPLVDLTRRYKADRLVLKRIMDFTGPIRQAPDSDKVTLSVEVWEVINRWSSASLKDLVYPNLPDLC